MPELDERKKEMMHIIEKVKRELTYYASRYRNNGTKGCLLPGTVAAMQKAIALICCMENQLQKEGASTAKHACGSVLQSCSRLPEQICECKSDFPEETPAPIYASRMSEVKMDLAGLSRYARDKGVSVSDLSEDEKNRFGVYTQYC